MDRKLSLAPPCNARATRNVVECRTGMKAKGSYANSEHIGGSCQACVGKNAMAAWPKQACVCCKPQVPHFAASDGRKQQQSICGSVC